MVAMKKRGRRGNKSRMQTLGCILNEERKRGAETEWHLHLVDWFAIEQMSTDKNISSIFCNWSLHW